MGPSREAATRTAAASCEFIRGMQPGGLGVWGGFCVLVLVKRDI